MAEANYKQIWDFVRGWLAGKGLAEEAFRAMENAGIDWIEMAPKTPATQVENKQSGNPIKKAS